ncbi:MAG: hypothetical protein PHY56_00190 [Candidatus Omnitrophica bacterium]|nr:hypothetical protein [Candidatus Omnitrophota bacterium]
MDPISTKLNEIYDDLESNVTFIYGRRDLLFGLDMIYHSVLSFYWGKELVQKGWCEGLIIGDTKTGKSKTIERILPHYGCGERFTGEKVTFAGLVGGVQQSANGKWTITWSVLPLNDRGLVCIDEAASESIKELIPSLSNIRSSGVAEIIAIQTAKTNARVRLLWSCNPIRLISHYDYGILSIRDFATQQEDIARFDFAFTMGKDEVTEQEIRDGEKRVVAQKYNKELCHNLVMWAWTRKPSDIIISAKVKELILDKSKELAKKYASPILLVEPHEQRIKIARLSIALACRLFSTDNGEKVLVLPEHVEFISNWLDMLYSKPCMAYDKYASIHQKTENISLTNYEQIKAELMEKPKWQHLVWIFLHATHFRKNDVCEQMGIETGEARDLFKWLSGNRLIFMGNKGYIKHPGFTKLLKELESEAEESEEA